MEMKKSDWALVREAEEQGLMVGMTGIVERNRTELNKELSQYFRKQMPNYSGSYDADEGEELLESINEFIMENQIDMPHLEYPYSEGSEIYLIPINENIQLKMIVADEYHGDGNFEKYVMADFFKINENATKDDVDKLIVFINKYMQPIQ